MSKNNKPRSRKDDVVLQEIDGEVLIYDLKVDKAFCLNQTSALVWQACDGKRTIAEIGDFVGTQLNAKVDEDIVWLALDQLCKEELIDGESMVAPGTLVSRRDAIKKAALTSMIALPVVASLVAPMAIHANSLCVAGGSCNCDTTMGTQGVECTTSGAGGVPCSDMNCRCIRQGAGNANGLCNP